MSEINKTEVSELRKKIDEVIVMAEKEKRVIILISANNEGKEAQSFIQGNWNDLVAILIATIKQHSEFEEILEQAITISE